MTDTREILQLAAKAAGYVIVDFHDDGAWVHKVGAIKNSDGEFPIFLWRPRVDDGDALRLAVAFHIDFYEGNDEGPTAYAGYFVRGDIRQKFVTVPHGTDPYAATRLAITKAAAEIGRAMKH